VVSVAEWVSGDRGSEKGKPLAWDIRQDDVTAFMGDWRVQGWLNYRARYVLPFAGGLLDQPLEWLTFLQVLDLVADTFTGRFSEKFKLDKLTPLQLALLTWVEKDETPNG